jgi:anti-anti-sigma factor
MSPRPAGPLLHVTVGAGRTTARVENFTRLTEDTAEAVGRAFDALAADWSASHLALDLGAVEFLSSIALTQLLTLNRAVRAGGGRLALTNLRPDVRRVFTLSRLDLLLDIEPAAPALAP